MEFAQYQKRKYWQPLKSIKYVLCRMTHKKLMLRWIFMLFKIKIALWVERVRHEIKDRIRQLLFVSDAAEQTWHQNPIVQIMAISKFIIYWKLIFLFWELTIKDFFLRKLKRGCHYLINGPSSAFSCDYQPKSILIFIK